MDLRTELKTRPLLFDGAMGTCYAARYGTDGPACEVANVAAPQRILDIHRDYLEAGCRAIKTNTFTLSAALAQGRREEAEAQLKAACALAKQAAAPYQALVFADLGPVPDNAAATSGEIFVAQARLFLEAGVTCFLAETLSNDTGIAELAAFLKQACPQSFLLVSFALTAEGMTQEGEDGAALLARAAALPGVDALGLNCVSGPAHLLQIYRAQKPLGKPFSLMPNAGYPTVLGRHLVFQGKPDYFAEKLAQAVSQGVAIVGGCCGTTPAHIARLARTLSGVTLPPALPVSTAKAPAPAAPATNRLWDKLESGQRVVAIELDPPADDRIAPYVENVRHLQAAGADVVTIADCPVGRPRADSSLLACKIRRETGMETLPHMTCRDRNMNAIKALLLGLSMEDVHNILLITGDPIPSTDRDAVKSVFNFNSRKLIRYVNSLNEQVLSRPFRIFAALNLNAANFDTQLRLAQEKEANGAVGFLTQPVLSAEALENLKQAREVLSGKLLGGIFPIVSHRNACFLNNEIAGMRVCPAIIDLYEGKERDEAEDLAIRISTQIAREVAPYTDGLYLMTPFTRVKLMTRLLEELRRDGSV